jgi:hypothetical protein
LYKTKRNTVIEFPVTFNDELSTVLPLRQLNSELLPIRKKVVMTYLEALSWSLLEETEYNKGSNDLFRGIILEFA